MNWLGDLVQKEVGLKDTVLDLGCGIMQATLDVVPPYPKTRLKCHFILGVDLYRPYLEKIKDKEGLAVLHCDVTNLSAFLDQSFDVVLLLDVVEHLPYRKAIRLIKEAERIARQRVVVCTPNVFMSNEKAVSHPYSYEGLGINPLQRHRSLISKDWFIKHDYSVFIPKEDNRTHIFAVKKFKSLEARL